MDNKSPLFQLMDQHMNDIMAHDKDYQSLVKKADVCTDKLDSLNLPRETRLLIDKYASEYNALGSRYGMLAYLLGFSDCRELLMDSAYPGKQLKRAHRLSHGPDSSCGLQ